MSTAPFKGREPGVVFEPPTIPPHPRYGREELSYAYVNSAGAPLYYVCRYQTGKGKTFLQGRPTDDGHGWIWNLRGVEPVLYRFDEVVAHLQSNDEHAPLYIVEGEKDADALREYLREHNLPGTATTNPMGAGKWREVYTETLRGARLVVVIVDNDDPGRKHGRHVAAELTPHVGELVVLRPGLDHAKADLSDHFDAALTLDDLLPLDEPIEETPAELAEGELLMNVTEFVALQVVPPPPLWGTEDQTLIAEGSFTLLAGRPHSGKTTFVIDLACHLAAGLPYPPRDEATKRAPEPWPVPRPLRIALFENEGPLELFRDKLKRKLQAFPHDIDELGGYLGVQVWRWGAFSFADDDAFTKAAIELEQKQIDLVIGDPLNMLGVEGVGSPADTRLFVQRLRQLGLGLRRAFLLIHHFRERVEHHEDEMRKLSGAWSGQLDTLVTLAQSAAPNEARLAFPKLRWSRIEPPKPVILGRVYNTAGFEAQGLEDDVALLEPKLVAALEELREAGEGYGGKGWQTSRNLATKIGKSKMDVPKSLEAAPHIFALLSGEAVKELGAKKTTKLWGLRTWADAPSENESGEAPPPPPAQATLGDDEVHL